MLRLRVPLGAGESPASFCSRLAYRTGAPTVHDFCRDMGFTFLSVVNGEPDALEELTRLGGCDREALFGNALRRLEDFDKFEYLGQSLRHASLRRTRLRVCPACLAEDMARWPEFGLEAVYGRSEWQVAHFRTCPTHRMPLVTAASEDTPKFVHDFSILIRPALKRIGVWMAEHIERKPSGLETYLRCRLHGLARRTTDWLDSLSFHAAARLCEIVGAVVLHGPQVKISPMTDDDWWKMGDVGYDALVDGPDGMRTVLGRLADTYWSGIGGTGPKALFGRLYEWLAHETDDPDYEPVRAVITQYVMDTMPVGPGGEIFGKPITERRLWSVYAASLETGVHVKRLRKMLAEGGIIPENTVGLTNHRVVFPATAAVETFLERASTTMSLKKAGEHINAPRVQITLLYRHGFITPFTRGAGNHATDPAFTSGDLDEFLSHLKADATELTDADTGLVDIPAAAQSAHCSAADVIRLLLDRRLARVRTTSSLRGYMSILVDPKEIRRLAHRYKKKGLTMQEIARVMKWSGPVIHALIENGWLPSRRVKNPLNNLICTLVDTRDLDSFNAKYVSLSGLARECGRHFLCLKKELKAAGVHPIFDPEMARATFYRRADLRYPRYLELNKFGEDAGRREHGNVG